MSPEDQDATLRPALSGVPRPRAPGPAYDCGVHCCADRLRLPVDVALALLRRGLHPGPALREPGGRAAGLPLAAGCAEELPGVLEWLEWGGVRLELTAHELACCGVRPDHCHGRAVAAPGAAGDGGPRRPRGAGTTLWLPGTGDPRTPEHPVDFVRLVSAAATECHRAWLHRQSRTQPLAFL